MHVHQWPGREGRGGGAHRLSTFCVGAAGTSHVMHVVHAIRCRHPWVPRLPWCCRWSFGVVQWRGSTHSAWRRQRYLLSRAYTGILVVQTKSGHADAINTSLLSLENGMAAIQNASLVSLFDVPRVICVSSFVWTWFQTAFSTPS